MMRQFLPFLAVLILAMFGCTTEVSETSGTQDDAQEHAGVAADHAHTFDVKCGCKIDGIGECGNYAMVDGQWVEITGQGITAMAFCGKDDMQAEIAGNQVNGKIEMTEFRVVE